MTRQLLKNHRTMGYEIGRTTADDGREFVILQTAPHKEEAAFARMLRPVTPDEAVFDARVLFLEAVEQARFLGLDAETIRTLVDDALLSSD